MHADVLAALGAELGLVEEHDGDAVEGVDFLIVEIVLGRADIALENAAAFPRLCAHVGLARVGATSDDLRSRRHACGGVVHFVLAVAKKPCVSSSPSW